MTRPTLSITYPTCEGCHREVEHDGDCYVCNRCKLQWGSAEEDVEGEPLYGDEEVCGAPPDEETHAALVELGFIVEPCSLLSSHTDEHYWHVARPPRAARG